MPYLSPRADLPPETRRILVAGTSGAGKTTAARRIAAAVGAPHTELDALFHGPNWTPRPAFVDDVTRLIAGPEWVTEWQYPAARHLLIARAQLLVWLDLPVRVVMSQVIRRTVRRRVHRLELWNGNREAPLRTILRDKEHIIRWAWDTRHDTGPRVADALRDYPDLIVVRLTSRRELDAWLAGPLAVFGEQ